MMDAQERELLGATIRQLASSTTGAELDAALADLGWSDALEAEPRIAIQALFEAQGEAVTTSGALHAVVGAALDRPDAVVVLPALGGWDPPGSGAAIDGVVLGDRGDGTELVVVIRDEWAGELSVVSVAAGDLEHRAASGMDPSLAVVRLSGDVAAGSSRTPLDDSTWEAALALGQLALGHELIGSMAAMLELARTHALERIQFGQPIAGFQAVRHRLADSYVALAAARNSVEAAWDDGSPLTAGVAKAICGRNARLVAKHAQQVLAGIGFTAEHRFHHHLRRVLLLDGLLGDAKHLTRAQGAELLRTRQVPAILPL